MSVETSNPTEVRRERGRAIAALCHLHKKKDGWHVPSQTGKGSYRVTHADTDSPRCDCPDFEKRGEPCKHVFAVQFIFTQDLPGNGFVSGDQAVRLLPKTTAPKKTYKQDWPLYNAAQTNEKHKFQVLLYELCRGIVEPPRKPGAGRKPVPLADLVFAVTFKVYSTISARRFMSDLSDSQAKGHITKAPHFSAIHETLELSSVTPILRALIAQSALPLKSIESDFAVDSTGFTSSRFIRWFDHKYGKPAKAHDWVKVSAMTGVKTNVVTAVEVDEQYAGDSPRFAPLVKATAGKFTIREVSADAAYCSYENMEIVGGFGGTPYINFPVNTTARGGGVFEKMFHLYNLNREEYLGHYHKRSNAESTFSMVKAKFGDSLRSKTDTAMVNEALCKILCHNICCLIASTYELSLTVTFWNEEAPKAAPGSSVAGNSFPEDIVDAFAWM